jgi:hypothetical protein
MPPTVQDILNRTQAGHPILGQPFDPLTNLDPCDPLTLIYGPRNGLHMNPPIPGVHTDPIVPPANLSPIAPVQFDPKVLELPRPLSGLKDFEAKPPANTECGGQPRWLRWEYAVGVFVLALAAGLLHALRRSKLSES